jgi:hypothetical protein
MQVICLMHLIWPRIYSTLLILFQCIYFIYFILILFTYLILLYLTYYAYLKHLFT